MGPQNLRREMRAVDTQEARKPPSQAPQGQAQAEPGVHDGWVVQGATDGQVLVIAMVARRKHLDEPRERKRKSWSEAAWRRRSSLLRPRGQPAAWGW